MQKSIALTAVVLGTVVASTPLGCGARPRGDDLGYDPAMTDLDTPADPLFDGRGLPMSRSGVPLRAQAVEGEWSTFRGNTERSGTRLAPGIVAPTILWSARVGIQGYTNTPLVGADAVYVSSQGDTHDAPDAADGFYALDVADGTRLWFHPTNEDINGASLTAELVIGGSDDGTLYAVERATGRRRWVTELGTPVRHGPLIAAGRVLMQTTGGVQVLDVATGAVLYVLAGSDDGWDVRGALAAADGRLFRTAEACQLDAWQDEDPAWSVPACVPSSDEWVLRSNYAPPAVVGDAVLVTAPVYMDYSGTSIALSLRDAATGSAYWAVEAEQTSSTLGMVAGTAGYDMHFHASVPWVMNGTAFLPQVMSSYVVGFDLRTGAPRTATDMGQCRCRQFGSIVGVPSRGYLARHDGQLVAFSPADGSIAWALTLRYAATAGPVTATTGSLAFLIDDNYCSADPWDGSALFATPAIGPDGVLYVGSGEGFLYAIGDETW